MYPWTEESLRIMKKTIYSKEHRILVERLKKARRERGLDQNAVAKLLGVTQSYISKIESGQRRIDVVQLKTFAKIYRKKIDFFIK
jgi:transcriptional regulator with XRE-family HTH domain